MLKKKISFSYNTKLFKNPKLVIITNLALKLSLLLTMGGTWGGSKVVMETYGKSYFWHAMKGIGHCGLHMIGIVN